MQSIFWQVLRSSSVANGLRSKEDRVFVSVCRRAFIPVRETVWKTLRGCVYVIWRCRVSEPSLGLCSGNNKTRFAGKGESFKANESTVEGWNQSWQSLSAVALTAVRGCGRTKFNEIQNPFSFIDILFMTSECNLLIEVRDHSSPQGTLLPSVLSLHAKGPTRAFLL